MTQGPAQGGGFLQFEVRDVHCPGSHPTATAATAAPTATADAVLAGKGLTLLWRRKSSTACRF
jgi:hypothetical protein